MSNKMIGMQVRHRGSHEIGVVKSIDGATVTIDFDDHIVRCAYPAAFSNILELEDEELQSELEGEGLTANFADFKRLYKISILHEIQCLKDTGGNKYRAVDGERLESRSDEYLYAFDMVYENEKIAVFQESDRQYDESVMGNVDSRKD